MSFIAGKPIFSPSFLLVFLRMKLMDLPSALVIEIQGYEVVKRCPTGNVKFKLNSYAAACFNLRTVAPHVCCWCLFHIIYFFFSVVRVLAAFRTTAGEKRCCSDQSDKSGVKEGVIHKKCPQIKTQTGRKNKQLFK